MTIPPQLLPVLVRPRYAGNVGSVLRLAANFGLDEVTVVDPEYDPDDPDLDRMAMGSGELVRLVAADCLPAALAACDAVVATSSSRDRDPRSVLNLEEAVHRVTLSGASRIALVFGPERSGLRRQEFQLAHMAATVPTSPQFPVLNLAQAAAVVIAAFARGRYEPTPPISPMDRSARAVEISAALAQLRGVLLATGFLDPLNPDRVMEQIARLIGRAVPTRREVAILRGIASHLDYLSRR